LEKQISVYLYKSSKAQGSSASQGHQSSSSNLNLSGRTGKNIQPSYRYKSSDDNCNDHNSQINDDNNIYRSNNDNGDEILNNNFNFYYINDDWLL
jgi:hypothetical protein